MTRLLVLIFAAALVAYAQCLSACTFAPCHHQGSQPKSCHQAPARTGCVHESLASPAAAGDEAPAAIADPVATAAPDADAPEAAPVAVPAPEQSPPPVRLTVLRI